MSFKKASFIKSMDKIENAPENRYKEILFVGKSNVGKSSLINALNNNKKLAFTSSKPGHTRLLNYFLIEDNFYFVDCPGYGYSSKKGVDYKFYGDMIEGYFNENMYLKLVIFLLDSRHKPTLDDLDFYNFIKETDYNYIFVMTKADKLNQSMKSKIIKNVIQVFGEIDKHKIFLVSISEQKTLEKLENQIREVISEE